MSMKFRLFGATLICCISVNSIQSFSGGALTRQEREAQATEDGYARYVARLMRPRQVLPAQEAAQKKCDICFEDKDQSSFKKLACGHSFCAECLQVIVKKYLLLRCPDASCKERFTGQDAHTIANGDEQLVQKFKDAMDEQLFMQKPGARHCRTPNCPAVFLNAKNEIKDRQCSRCKEIYCANCALKHAPTVSCSQAQEKEDEKNKKDKAWLEKNTKQCPQCAYAIQKNDGCNHMTCNKCQHEFYWCCLKKYEGGLAHSCPNNTASENDNLNNVELYDMFFNHGRARAAPREDVSTPFCGASRETIDLVNAPTTMPTSEVVRNIISQIPRPTDYSITFVEERGTRTTSLREKYNSLTDAQKLRFVEFVTNIDTPDYIRQMQGFYVNIRQGELRALGQLFDDVWHVDKLYAESNYHERFAKLTKERRQLYNFFIARDGFENNPFDDIRRKNLMVRTDRHIAMLYRIEHLTDEELINEQRARQEFLVRPLTQNMPYQRPFRAELEVRTYERARPDGSMQRIHMLSDHHERRVGEQARHTSVVHQDGQEAEERTEQRIPLGDGMVLTIFPQRTNADPISLGNNLPIFEPRHVVQLQYGNADPAD